MSRCLIYKVHTAHQRRALILPHSQAFVKNFFQVFLNFFVLSFAALRAAAAVATVSHLTTSPSLCQELFSTFFKVSFVPDPAQPLRMPRSRGQLGHNTTCLSLCQEVLFDFFEIFFGKFPGRNIFGSGRSLYTRYASFSLASKESFSHP